MRRRRIIFACLMLCFCHTHAQSVYRNRNYGFTVSQPKGWSGSEGLDKNGVEFSPLGAGASGPEIHVGGRINQPSEMIPGKSQTLDEIINSIPDTLKEFEHATKLSVLKRDHIMFAGLGGRC